MRARHFTSTDQELATTAMASLPAAAGFLLVVFSVILYGCCGQDITRYNITPDSCDHCLTLDEFASNNTNKSVALFLSPGNHTLTRNIEMVGVDQFSILADTSVTIQCASPASFLFEEINNIEIKNTAIVSCGGGDSSRALQVRSVQHFNLSNVTLQESASVSLNVQDSNGLVTGARFIGNTGAGMNITNSTVVFEGNNTFSDNLDGGIASYDSTLQFSGVNQFTNNTATINGGGISAISSTINCSGNMTFEYNSAEKNGGGIYLSDTRMTIESNIRFIGNTQTVFTNNIRNGGGGLSAVEDSVVNINAVSDFIHNSAARNGGGLSARQGATVNINAESNFINNSAVIFGGGLSACLDATVNINAKSNFINNSAVIFGGGLSACLDTTVNINAKSNFINNSAESGCGLYAWGATVNINAESNFINNSAVLHGGGLFAYYGATVNINAESNFISNSADEGGGLHAFQSKVNISRESNFMYNSARDGGGVYVRYGAIANINGTSNFMYNSAQQDGGGVYADDAAKLYISGSSNFMCNSAQRYGGAVFLQQSEVHISDNSSFTMNSASHRGGGMYLHTNSIAYIRDGFFSDNWSWYGGGISILQSEIMLQGRTVFSNNNASYGGAIQAFEANVNVTGSVDFTKNLATVNGGALALDGYSVVYIFETALLTFVENRAASFGGAIYIEDNSVHCSYDWNINGFIGIYDSTGRNEYTCWEADSDFPSCFNTALASFKDKINLAFSGNSATAGSAIFGGEIDEAITNIMFAKYPTENTFTTTVGDLFQYLFSVSINESNAQPTISSNPNRICGCVNGQPDCSDSPSPYEVTVYPGQTVGVSLVAVGQRNGTVPATTTAKYYPDNGANFLDLQSIQGINHTTCSELYYTIFSRKQTETFKIYVDSSCGSEGIPLSVNVTLLKCPIGFTLSNSSDQCVCEERLQKYTSSCNISNLEITRTASEDFWVGVDNTNGTEGLILHPHCPFDYCITDTVNFTLNDVSLTDNDTLTNATMNDTEAAIGNSIDAQCKFSRSGLLCGKCQKGFSVVFGSSKCLKCSNSYLSLLIAFALAGIVLVVFLLVLKLTVAVGTINGLIFYANIVSVNRAQLFPSGETNVLTVFIAWVNLDLGIETCFFDGMDAYSKAWLQYAFPIYVWVLVGAIILASRYSTRITRSFGTNPVAVLATLFLLSYAKLLRSIINPLFFTFLKYPSDTKEVWLVDGNIPYLKGKHIPLFLTSLLALFLLFIPFTLLLLLGQWIQAQSERKCFKWISDYRVSTFLDMYHGPFKNKHRYWSGLLLVTRFCLFLVLLSMSMEIPV